MRNVFLSLLLSCALLPALASANNTHPLAELGPFSAQHKDPEMVSPKSVLFHPDGSKFYVNALEAGKTLVYDAKTFEKRGTITHEVRDPASLVPQIGGKVFGKPVEGWFTHQGRYLWVTYYRWSSDAQAMGASGIGLIDTRTDKLVRAYPTGNIPKFVTANADSTVLAVTLWGENQVELFDIREPEAAHSLGRLTVGPPVHAPAGSNRDATCGMCLRGTVFIPGTSWLAIARMSAGGGMAIVDTVSGKVLADWKSLPATPRHLQIWGDWLYLSANASGTVARLRLADIKAAVTARKAPPVESKKVGAGARTLKVTAEGVYVALNESKQVAVLSHDFSKVRYLEAPAFPVGLDVANGILAVTSQGRQGVGGHRVWLYDLHD